MGAQRVSGTHQTAAGGAGIWGEGLPWTVSLAIVAAACGGDGGVTRDPSAASRPRSHSGYGLG